MGIVFILEQKTVTHKMVEIYMKLLFMPILEPNPEYATRQKMHISYCFSSEVVFAKNLLSFKPKKMHFRHKITYPIFNSIYDL